MNLPREGDDSLAEIGQLVVERGLGLIHVSESNPNAEDIFKKAMATSEASP